jgi:hypothetical protein
MTVHVHPVAQFSDGLCCVIPAPKRQVDLVPETQAMAQKAPPATVMPSVICRQLTAPVASAPWAIRPPAMVILRAKAPA